MGTNILGLSLGNLPRKIQIIKVCLPSTGPNTSPNHIRSNAPALPISTGSCWNYHNRGTHCTTSRCTYRHDYPVHRSNHPAFCHDRDKKRNSAVLQKQVLKAHHQSRGGTSNGNHHIVGSHLTNCFTRY